MQNHQQNFLKFAIASKVLVGIQNWRDVKYFAQNTNIKLSIQMTFQFVFACKVSYGTNSKKYVLEKSFKLKFKSLKML